MNNPPLLVIGHGTRRPAGVGEFLEFIDRVRRRAEGRVPGVEGGLIELARPTVSDGVDRLLRREGPGGNHPAGRAGTDRTRRAGGTGSDRCPVGSRPGRIAAVPLLLGTAGHIRSDIPALLAAEQDRRPGLTFALAPALGPHPILQDLLGERLDTALDGAPRAGTSVVLVGRGTTDPQANADVAGIARSLWEGSGLDAVELSFVAVTGPSLPQALERLRRVGARRIVVVPHLLFPGLLSEQIATETALFGAEHPDLDLRVAGLIGEGDRLADLVLHRYRQACTTAVPALPSPAGSDLTGTPGHF